MNTTPDDSSDWDELARELAINKKPASPAPEPAVADEPVGTEPVEEESDFIAEAHDLGDDESGETDESTAEEAEGEGDTGEEAHGEGQPGTGRKRRRRRRRRRKGGAGQPGEAASGTAEAAEATEPEETATTFEEEPAEGGYDAGPSGEVEDEDADAEPDADSLVGAVEEAEDAGGELLRDLIANWNVPSWDDIVGGLYRPDR